MQFLTDEPVQLVGDEIRKADGTKKSYHQELRDEKAGLCPPSVRVGNRKFKLASEYEVYKQTLKARRDFPEMADKLTEWLKAEKKAKRNPWSREKIEAFLQSQRKSK